MSLRSTSTPPQPTDFETRGAVHIGNSFLPDPAAIEISDTHNENVRKGIGCCPGQISGRVRVVFNPREANFEKGEILVAETTDPGWVMLFPACSGLLVERGSLLSHSAIVAREMGIPAVVAVSGLTQWLQTGDHVEFDGSTGLIHRIQQVDPVEA